MVELLFEEDKYAKAKLEQAKTILKKSYYETSNFNKLVDSEDASVDETNFQQLYFRTLIPKEWFTREDVIIDIAFEQFGANLAHSEIYYIIDRIFGEQSIPKIDVGINLRENVIANIKAFSQTKEISSLLAPIDYFVDMHTKWLSESPNEITMDYRTGTLSFFGMAQNIIWSNKYKPFDDFVLVDKTFSKWISKPNFVDRLMVKISESNEIDKLDLHFLVNMKFEIVDANKVLILQTPKQHLLV